MKSRTEMLAWLDGRSEMSRENLAMCTDAELAWTIEDIQRRADGGSGANVRRADSAFEDDVRRRVDEEIARRGGGGARHVPSVYRDTELAELCARFDAAPDELEAFHRADPWKYGSEAAAAAARKSVGR